MICFHFHGNHQNHLPLFCHKLELCARGHTSVSTSLHAAAGFTHMFAALQ